MLDCVYLGAEHPSKTTDDGRQTYECQIHKICTKVGEPNPYASCTACKDKLRYGTKSFARDYKDPLIIMDRTRRTTHALRNMLNGGVSFLVCGGPSATALPMDLLTERGVWSIAVNNAAGKYRTNAFVHADPPSKFHHGIWSDPSVMKFTPTVKLVDRGRGRLRVKHGDDFEPYVINGQVQHTIDMPNVWGFGRRSWFTPDHTFFTTTEAAWGNHDAGAKQTNEEKTTCTMLLALRLLYYLGSRRIYLVGVDFWMDPSKAVTEQYAFKQERTKGAIDSNNNIYRVVNKWLCKMQENQVFSNVGLEIYNCCQNSGLRAFPYVPFEQAIDDALNGLPDTPYDLAGWYDSTSKSK